MIKISRIFLMFFYFLFMSSFGNINKINSIVFRDLRESFEEFHCPISSGCKNPIPDLLKCKKSELFVAKINSFGVDSYFSFETNDDVNKIVKRVRGTIGNKVYWYCLKNLSSDFESAQ